MAFGRRRRSGGPARPNENAFAERGFIVSAAILAFVLFAGVVVMINEPSPTPTAADGTSRGPRGVGTASTGFERTGDPQASTQLRPDGSCPAVSAPHTDAPMAQPHDTRWQSVGGFLLPVSASLGPAVIHGDVARCYARTPLGAVFAALNSSWRYRLTTDWGAAAQHLLAPGPGRDAYIRQRSDQSTSGALPQSIATSEGFPQPLGFRVLDAGLDRLRIDVICAPLDGGGRGTHTIWSVRWLDGDWRLELPVDGNPPASTPVTAADAFVGWDLTSVAAAATPHG